LYGTALRRGDARSYGHAIFLGVFGSMQVVDAALWWNDAHGGNGAGLAGCDLFNRGWTRVGLAIICLEPAAALVGTHVVARRAVHPVVAVAYLSLFVLTPLAGTSLLRVVTDGVEALPSFPTEAFFSSEQIGSGPRWRARSAPDGAATIPDSPPPYGGGGVGVGVSALESKSPPSPSSTRCELYGPWLSVFRRDAAGSHLVRRFGYRVS